MNRPRLRASGAGVFALVFAVATVPLVPGTAVAHGAAHPIPDAAYYRAELLEVTPTPPGVQVRVDPAGEWIELTNTGPADVIVLGYTREPYLRVTPTTVDENQLSQSTYLNRSLFADSVPSGRDTGSVAPAWKEIGQDGVARWHDHRIHWMGQARPPVVAADPRHPHQIGDWTVHATSGGQPFQIRGVLRWIGKPDAADGNQPIPEWLLWLIEGMAVVIAVLAGAVVFQRGRSGGSSGGSPAVAAGNSGHARADQPARAAVDPIPPALAPAPGPVRSRRP